MRSCRPPLALVVLLLALPSTGCIKSMLVNGQIAGTRQASGAFDGIDDYELAAKAVAAGLVQFEGMHVLAPDNEDALFMLTKGWTGYAFGFAEDDLEVAEDAGDRDAAEYHRARAGAAYQRAIDYGLTLINSAAGGFDEAKKGEATLKAWLAESFTSKEDAQPLFWTGYAWIARTNVRKDDAEAVANLYIGVAFVERSVELDPDYNNMTGTLVLASYHARAAMAELDQAKELFERVLAKTERKSAAALFLYGSKYACAKADGASYKKLLDEALAVEGAPTSMRLTNTLAKRRARRWLGEQRMFNACAIELAPEPSTEGATSMLLR
ncbi:MAG: hypothetical protein IT384_14775 [Deltaproteobacteria bacterium]|nr:hypothetical protein [Deltaproteobacteria bacterium]